MTRKYFGTDGIRGRANRFPMTADMALKVAMAAAKVMHAQNGDGAQKRVVIGKDTRLSGYMLEQAMAAGFIAMGMDVIFLGPLPTPGVAVLTRSMRADIGVVISASHNPFEDNGIKLFGADGFKLPDAMEEEIERLIDEGIDDVDLPAPSHLGKATKPDDAIGRYVEFLKASFPRRQTLEGLKIVIDCAHGAGYKVGPKLLWELEAEVIPMGVNPDGRNINDRVGATSPERLALMVQDHQADIGLALDGDADRIIIVNERGQVVDGDQIMALLATSLKAQGALANDTLVATVMSNLGLERFLNGQGITLLRTPVGDRHVVEAMRKVGHNLGGEQSGHIIMSDYVTTGDGLLTALQVLAVLKETGIKASKLLHQFDPLPQLLRNVRYDGASKPLDQDSVKAMIEKVQADLDGGGRLLVRASGTEPVIRVMAEGDDQNVIEHAVGQVCDAIEKAGKA